ncbi:MAG TPA: YbaB/EbfC family nucleoid-associated protein [Campylobacterales bacterium]|nr:YbaB/EbfC family nucleoid-associated protein [Campylobacterales bacterium]
MFEGFDMSKLGAVLEEAQKKAKEMETRSSTLAFSAKSGGGLVSATVNGKFEVLDITIDDSLLEDKESLQILLMSAINDAMKSAAENQKNEAMSMLGGLNPFAKNG